MFKNYVKLAWRNLKKNKVFSFINIFGLSIGLTCCMLISLYVYNELNYDTYHKNGDRLYQLGTEFISAGKEERGALALLRFHPDTAAVIFDNFPASRQSNTASFVLRPMKALEGFEYFVRKRRIDAYTIVLYRKGPF